MVNKKKKINILPHLFFCNFLLVVHYVIGVVLSRILNYYKLVAIKNTCLNCTHVSWCMSNRETNV